MRMHFRNADRQDLDHHNGDTPAQHRRFVSCGRQHPLEV